MTKKHTPPLFRPDKIVTLEDGTEELWALWGYRRGDQITTVGSCTDPVLRQEIIESRLRSIRKAAP